MADPPRYLREADIDGGDDERMTMEVERILGGAEHLTHLPDLLRLVAAEEVSTPLHADGGGVVHDNIHPCR